MNITIMTQEQVRAAISRKKAGNNNIYDMFLRHIVEDGAPGISFSATDAGYSSAQSAYKAVVQHVKGKYPSIRVSTRGDMVYVYKVPVNPCTLPQTNSEMEVL